MSNNRKILKDLDFTPEPFYYQDNGLGKWVVLCMQCSPGFWDECLGETTADLVLKEHILQYHPAPGGQDAVDSST